MESDKSLDSLRERLEDGLKKGFDLASEAFKKSDVFPISPEIQQTEGKITRLSFRGVPAPAMTHLFRKLIEEGYEPGCFHKLRWIWKKEGASPNHVFVISTTPINGEEDNQE